LSLLGELQARAASLRALRASREQQIKALAVQISELWQALAVPKAESQLFLEAHSGLGLTTLAACQAHLAELQTLRLAGLAEETASCRVAIDSHLQALGENAPAGLRGEAHELQARQKDMLSSVNIHEHARPLAARPGSVSGRRINLPK
jgi:hypothetical protein